MREVSVRMLHIVVDLARTAEIEERTLTAGLRSVATRNGRSPEWIDWEDYLEVLERFDRLVGGQEGIARAARAALPIAYPEFRALAAVFLRPLPLFSFAMKRIRPTLFRHLPAPVVEQLGDDRVRWTQVIPAPYRVSEIVNRMTLAMIEIFPCHLDMPEATVELFRTYDRSADFVVRFPPSDPIMMRGVRAASSAASVLAVQLDDAFARIAAALGGGSDDGAPASQGGPSEPAVAPSSASAEWAERLALSPRQREVFALLVEGRANKEIASTLACSERNVEFHVGKILRAAHVTSRAELLVKVLSTHA